MITSDRTAGGGVGTHNQQQTFKPTRSESPTHHKWRGTGRLIMGTFGHSPLVYAADASKQPYAMLANLA